MIQKTLSRSKAFIIFFIYTVIVAALTSCTTHKNPPEASQLEGYLIFANLGFEELVMQVELGASKIKAVEVANPKMNFPVSFKTLINNEPMQIEKLNNRDYIVPANACEIDHSSSGQIVKFIDRYTEGYLNDCGDIWWSPDLKHAAFSAEKGFYVTGLDGKASLVLERREQSYQSVSDPSVPILGMDYLLISDFDFGGWLSPDAFLINHFLGDFPAIFHSQTTLNLPVSPPIKKFRDLVTMDTTSLVMINKDSVEIKDLPDRWLWVITRTPDFRNWVLFSGGGYLVGADYLMNNRGMEPAFIKNWRNVSSSPDSTRLAIEIDDKNIGLWDVQTHKEFRTYPLPPKSSIRGKLIWSPNSDAIAFRVMEPKTDFPIPDIYVLMLTENKFIKLSISFSEDLRSKFSGGSPELKDWVATAP